MSATRNKRRGGAVVAFLMAVFLMITDIGVAISATAFAASATATTTPTGSWAPLTCGAQPTFIYDVGAENVTVSFQYYLNQVYTGTVTKALSGSGAITPFGAVVVKTTEQDGFSVMAYGGLRSNISVAAGYCNIVTQVAIPSAPAVVDDPSVKGDAHYTLPADTESLNWTLNSDGSVTVTTKSGYEFTDGTTSKSFPAPVDKYTPPVPSSIALPATPQKVDDPTKQGDAHYVAPADTAVFDYSQVGNTVKVCILTPNTVFAVNGQTCYAWPAPADTYNPPAPSTAYSVTNVRAEGSGFTLVLTAKDESKVGKLHTLDVTLGTSHCVATWTPTTANYTTTLTFQCEGSQTSGAATGKVLVGGCQVGKPVSFTVPAQPSGGECTHLTGSIKTAPADGSVVNENHYTTKADVYVSGSHLGDVTKVYVRVTDPSGASVLSGVKEVAVVDGAFGPVQAPTFEDSPNREYKVWVSTSPQFADKCTKTDNFKVGSTPTPTTTTSTGTPTPSVTSTTSVPTPSVTSTTSVPTPTTETSCPTPTDTTSTGTPMPTPSTTSTSSVPTPSTTASTGTSTTTSVKTVTFATVLSGVTPGPGAPQTGGAGDTDVLPLSLVFLFLFLLCCSGVFAARRLNADV